MNKMIQDSNFREQMLLKNRASSNSGISNPLPQSDFFISEGDRLFGENFATGEYYRRKAENEKKKERYKFRQSQQMERERRRWERIDYEYLRRENQNMVNKEKNLVGRKNNPGMAFNPLNLQYDNSVQGEILKRRDEESKYRAWMRSLNIDKHSNAGYNIINGEERTILEERLNKDIVPDLIQKNMEQIKEMKNKVFNKNTNFFTSVNRNNNSPQLGRYRYENSNNNGYMNMNNVNRSATPNMPNEMFNNNGGRFREPVQYRNNMNMNDNIGQINNNRNNMNDINNNFNNFKNGNTINQRNNNMNNNNNYRNYNDNYGRTPLQQRQMSPQENQYDRNNNLERNNNMNEINNNYNNMNNNMDMNLDYKKMNITPNNNNNQMNDNFNNNYRENDQINQMRNMSPENNIQDQGPSSYNNYGVNPYNPYSRQNI